MPRFEAVNDTVLAAGTSSAGSTRGTIAPWVEEATANPAACTATSPSSSGRLATSSRAAASSPPVHPHRVSDAPSSSSRRSTASATAPPQSPNITSGTSPTSPSIPTQNEDPVSWYPMNPSEFPSHNRRKASWRSGSTSIAARRSRRSAVIAPQNRPGALEGRGELLRVPDQPRQPVWEPHRPLTPWPASVGVSRRSGRAKVSSARVSSMGWGGGQLPVGLSGKLPAAVVDGPMMSPAQQHQVGQVGRATVQPVPQVMGFAPGQGAGTAGEDTAPITRGQGGALGGGHDPGGPAQVQGLAGDAAQDRGQQGGRGLEPGRQPAVPVGGVVVAAGVVLRVVAGDQ